MRRYARYLRSFLRRKLEGGFWFPVFRSGISRLYHFISLGERLNSWLRNGDNAPLGAIELYQTVWAFAGAIWLAFLIIPRSNLLTTPPFRVIGSVIALYPITELFLFSLHWIFVAEEEIESTRRSLATYIFSLIELGLFSSISLILLGCHDLSRPSWSILYDHFTAILRLEPVAVRQSVSCGLISHYEFVVVITVMLIIIASIVGAIVRPERKSNGDLNH